MNKANAIFTAAMMLAIIAAAAAMNWAPGGDLVIRDADDSSVEYYRAYLSEGSAFSITFIHSVNKTPYTDYYIADSDGIYLTGARFYSYGAGVESEAGPGQTLEICEDGSILVSGGVPRRIEPVYMTAALSDHILGINGERISLALLCGRKKAVEIVYE